MKKWLIICHITMTIHLIYVGVSAAKSPIPDDNLFPPAARDYTEARVHLLPALTAKLSILILTMR